MDIANYLSELLNQYNEISVPGLGCLSRTRVSGYYNEAEGTFYPPHYQLSFDLEEKSDDTLVNYIAEKKRISVTSATYFTEKYISNLKQEIALHQVILNNLGRFYSIGGQIAFKPFDHNNDAPFYGLSTIKVDKINGQETEAIQSAIEQPIIEEPVHVEPEPIIEEPQNIDIEPEFINTEPEYITQEQQPEPYIATTETIVEENEPVSYIEPETEYATDEYEEQQHGVSTWIIVLIFAFVIASAVLTVYKFNPGLLGMGDKPVHQPDSAMRNIKPAPIPADTAHKDTTTTPVKTAPKAISKPDSTLTKTVTSADSSTQPAFVIFLASFKTANKSEVEIKRYKAKNVDARLLTGPGTGPRKKIVVGNFATSAEAETERKKLIAAKKINTDSYTQQINISK